MDIDSVLKEHGIGNIGRVKSVQRGVATFDSTMTYLEVTISPVADITKCVVSFPMYVDVAGNIQQVTVYFRGKVTSSNKLTIYGTYKMGSTYASTKVAWQVTEYQ